MVQPYAIQVEPVCEVGDFIEPCPKCRGRGVRYFGRDKPTVPCAACGGVGRKAFKAPAEKRAQTRVKAKERKERKLKAAIDEFQVTFPAIWEWMHTADVDFASKMREALFKWGTLTERQFAISEKLSKLRYIKRSLL